MRTLWRALRWFFKSVDYPRRARAGSWRRWIPTWWQTVAFTALFALGGVTAIAVVVMLMPYPRANDIAVAQLTTLTWRDGNAMTSIGEANRRFVRLDDVSMPMRDAILAAEDHEFYTHSGFSPRAVARATAANLRGGDLQGGSTITQQYAKNTFLSGDRTMKRKVREILLSLKLETQIDKNTILQDYLNTIWFGRDSYGIDTAAQAYFNKQPKQLDVAESAMLAAMVRAPGLYDPDRHRERLERRWNYVLDQMVLMRTLSTSDRQGLAFPQVSPYTRRQPNSGTRGYLVAAVKRQLLSLGFSQRDIDLGGLRVRTTFDATKQEAMRDAVMVKAPTINTKGLRIGAVAMNPLTGEVLAMYGGSDYLQNQLNNATDSIGQAGSTFKVFALAAALENGYTLKSVVNGRNGQTFHGYTVHNFANENFGRISLLDATVHSVNNAYVGVTNDVGPEKVMQAAVRAGIPADTPGLASVLSIPLGTCSPHAIDMARAYSTFAAHGRTTTTSVIAKVTDANGRVLWSYQPKHTQAFSRTVADSVTYALREVVKRGTGVAAGAAGQPAAGKTGTTNEHKGAWFVGYTPTMTAAFMFTKDDAMGNPVSLNGTGGLGSFTGGSFPARTWAEFTKRALAGEPVRQFDLMMNSGSNTATAVPIAPTSGATDAGGPQSQTSAPATESSTPGAPTPVNSPPIPSGSTIPPPPPPPSPTRNATNSVPATPTGASV